VAHSEATSPRPSPFLSYLLVLHTKQKVISRLSYANLGRHSVTIADTVRPTKSIQRKQAAFILDATIK